MAFKKTLMVAVAVLCGSFAWQLALAEQSADGLALTQKMAGLTSLSGDFEQRQYGEDGTLLGAQQGSFKIVMPGKLRWETVEPMPQLLISDGSRYWLHDPDLEQVTTGVLEDNLQMAPAILFSGDMQQLQQDYRISQVGEGTFQLWPRGENSLFKYLQLAFAESQLQGFELFDHMGQRTQFVLLNTAQNLAIADSTFRFDIPPGSDVINQ